MLENWLMGAFISIIGECNYRCSYCSASEQIEEGRIISYSEIEDIYKILKEKRLCKINITGGEPFLHNDIERIITLSLNNFSTTVLTNGSLVNKHISYLSKITQKNRLHFSVSLDSGDPISNDRTRGAGTYKSSLEGIEILIRLGYSVNVLSTITNGYTLEDLKALTRTVCKIGGKQINLTPLQPMGMAKSSFDKMRPRDEILSQILESIPSLTKKYNINIGTGYGKCYDDSREDQKDVEVKNYSMLPCKAGITQISIRSNGDVYPCNALEICMGNIFKDGIDYILYESEGAKVIRALNQSSISQHKMCNECQYNDRCTGGCRGVAYGYTGDILAPDIYCDQLVRRNIKTK